MVKNRGIMKRSRYCPIERILECIMTNHQKVDLSLLTKVEEEDEAHELRRLYIDAVTGLKWGVEVRMERRQGDMVQ